MEVLAHGWHTLWSFVVVISVIVFFHEFGHYLIAKICGVRIVAFSIGFGKELIGWNDRSGTRWKISLLPLGGYVKMYGDASAASTADEDEMEKMTAEEKAQTFHHKPLYKKAAIVAAGPLANFVLTIAIFTYFIMTSGLPSVEPIVGSVMPKSPALAAGLKAGDRILRVGDDEVDSFSDIPYFISTNLGTPVTLQLLRGDKEMSVTLTPKAIEEDDGLGNKVKRPLIGIKSAEIKYQDVGFAKAVEEAVHRTYQISVSTLKFVGQMATGKRSACDLRGPVGIAQMSGQAASKDVSTVLWLIAMLSVNLGLVNLFPIPLLDGGHLAYYAAEAFRGRPLAQKVQEWGFKAGFLILGALMLFSLINDLYRHC